MTHADSAADNADRSASAQLADSIRRAVIAAGAAAYEDAGIQGLCAEGRWEAAVAAMRAVDVAGIARSAASAGDPRPSATGRTDTFPT
jgi:hypothetical protein